MVDNTLLVSVNMLNTIIPLLHSWDRTPISKLQLKQTKTRLEMMLSDLKNDKTINCDIRIFTAIIDVVTLIDALFDEPSFVETSDGVKHIICSRIEDLQSDLYMLAATYYTTVEFDYTPTLTPILNKIIDYALTQGYYFNMGGTS